MRERRDAWIDREYGDCVPPSPPFETHRGSPEHVDRYPIVGRFGDFRDEITRQAIRGDRRKLVEGELLRSWLKRRSRRWWQ